MKILKGMAAVVMGGAGCFMAVVFLVVLVIAFSAAALGNALPEPLQSMYWAWLLHGVPDRSDAVLPIGGWKVPYDGYDGPASFVCAVPAQGTDVMLTDCFGSPRRWGYHHGMDFGVNVGTPVITPMGGKVVYAAYSPVGYGNLVVIENRGYQVFLAHNSTVTVRVGDIVTAGEVVAYSGNTGISTGPHLHFEIRRVDPKGAVSLDPPTVMLPGQTKTCDWYRLAPANNYETKGCQRFH